MVLALGSVIWPCEPEGLIEGGLEDWPEAVWQPVLVLAHIHI